MTREFYLCVLHFISHILFFNLIKKKKGQGLCHFAIRPTDYPRMATTQFNHTFLEEIVSCHDPNHTSIFPTKHPDSFSICDQTFSQCFIMLKDKKLVGLPLGMSLLL